MWIYPLFQWGDYNLSKRMDVEIKGARFFFGLSQHVTRYLLEGGGKINIFFLYYLNKLHCPNMLFFNFISQYK